MSAPGRSKALTAERGPREACLLSAPGRSKALTAERDPREACLLTPPRHWVAVASAEHVGRGRAEGFMQVCHGRAVPLRRLRPGDRVVYYSPTALFKGREPLQAFTALGTVRAGDPYVADMGGGFHPTRRDVDWDEARPAPIRPLLPRLAFARGGNWGYAFRFGLFEIDAQDMACIAEAMHAA